ncbi:hypothetical protein [Streptomyces sp. NPDC127197]|uniref:hypothetical protein n=1 Tax=Streptomyces sp. NPDC127197 TaxID=3345388 RepID=UPI003628FD72
MVAVMMLVFGHLHEVGLGAIADLGFTGLDDDLDNPVIITGFKAARQSPHHGEEAGQQVDRRRTHCL